MVAVVKSRASVPFETVVPPVEVLLPLSVMVPVPTLLRVTWPVPVAKMPAKVPPPVLPLPMVRVFVPLVVLTI